MLKQKSLDLISKPVIKVMFDLKKKKKSKRAMPKTDLLEPRTHAQEVDKSITHICSFGDQELSSVTNTSVLTFMIIPWGLPS